VRFKTERNSKQLVRTDDRVLEALDEPFHLAECNKVGGEVWPARTYDEDQVIPVGTKVDVFQIKGATALVHPVPELG